MTDTESGFLRAILDAPGDDLPRMVYSDWLEENAGDVECGGCRSSGRTGWVTYPRPAGVPADWDKCPICSSTGRVSNGFAERAEFVRLQCELAILDTKFPDRECKHMDYSVNDEIGWKDAGGEALRQRERELWRGVEPWDFVRSVAKPDWTLTTFAHGTRFRFGPREGHRDDITCEVSRGFVSRVSAPLAVLVGGECERCVEGRGPIYVESGVEFQHKCRYCHGTGRTPGIAREIAKCQPVTTWVATDKEPSGSDGNFGWFGTIEGAGGLPLELWCKLSSAWGHPTSKLALAALSRAIGEIAKQGDKV